MFMSMPFKSVVVFVAVLCIGALSPQAMGEGTETLGPPAIAIAPGTGVVAAGVGLSAGQPDTISIDIPGDVSQALLYWQGVSNTETGDDTIKVDGSDVVGTLIGGITYIPGPKTYISCYRADITDLVAPGPNVLSIDGLAFDRNNDGAGVIAIFDDGSGASDIEIRDGCDFVYINNADSPDFPSGTLQTSVPQTFTFAPAAADRVADLLLFASDVQIGRPNLIEVTVGATTTGLWDLLASTDGLDWDTVRLSVFVAAGESDLTVEMISAPDGSGRNPASLIWLAAAFSIDEEEENGGVGCTPGYWKNHLDRWPAAFSLDDDFDTTFGVDLFDPDITLDDAIRARGGQENRLARHGTAALLNAAHPDVDYPATVAEVIAAVQAGDADALEGFNELGCPLGGTRASRKK